MQLIDGARQWWRLHSNKLAIAAGALAVLAEENRHFVMQIIDALPEGVRQVAVFLLISIPPIIVRMSKQGGKANG